MITDSFLDSCFTLILNRNSKIKKTKALYRDILEVLDFSESRETYEIPLNVKSKLDCLKKISKMLLEDREIQNILDSISFSEKFMDHRDYLDLKVNEKIKDHAFEDIVKQVRLRKKIAALFKNYDDLDKVLESIKDGSFDSIDDLVEDYEVTIKTLYSNMMEANRSVTIEAAASLDLGKDDYTSVIEMINKKYDKTNKTPTGFTTLDGARVMAGGYEPSRLYVFGGGSGAGKSTFLNNTIIQSATKNLASIMPEVKAPVPGEIHRVYVYVTLENTIEEALMRTYQPMFDRTTSQMLQDIRHGNVDISKMIKDELAKNSAAIVMKYFPAMSVSPIDLMGVVDDVIDQYGQDCIAGLYVDYLDLLKTDTKYDMYRIELGHITLALKTLAVQYNIPVVTGTQLSRGVYKISSAQELNVNLMSESIKKVEHADFVALLARNEFDNNLIHGKIGKNRSGETNVAIDFNVDFARFKFLHDNIAANKEKQDDSSRVDCMSFEGMDNCLF
jgi:replicative DNA helicase